MRISRCVKTRKKHTRSTRKVRRDWLGGKRGDGHRRQQRGQRVRRADPSRVRIGKSDEAVTGCGGLVPFGTFVRGLGVDGELGRLFERLKSSHQVVYPMGAQLRLLMDAFVLGECRPFGLEALSGDPLFVFLAGGVVPSLDTVYRDLARFDAQGIAQLEHLMIAHGVAPLLKWRRKRGGVVHLDIDTTVTPLFGEHEGALPGPNPRYHGRPSYHPILARVAETDTVVGGRLRPGDTSFGAEDAPTVLRWVDGVRDAVGPDVTVFVRADAAADCTEVLKAIADRGAYFLVKARITHDVQRELGCTTRWTTLDWDADDKPSLQYAQLDFARQEWRRAGLGVRVIAFRSRERDAGKQVALWDEVDYSVQVLLTNDWDAPAPELIERYRGRAGIEPLIAELKNAYGIGKVPSTSFAANHAALLLKMLAHNLMRRFVERHYPRLGRWRAAWLRRALLRVPARLIRHGRRRTLRPAPRSLLKQLE